MKPASPGSFKPGYDPRRDNAGRKPGSRSIGDMLRRIGQEQTTDDNGKPVDKLEQVIQRVYEFACKGQGWAVAFIAERTEGKVPDKVDMTHSAKPVREMTMEEIEAELRADG